MPRTDFLKPLNDLAYCCECAALDYTGELKSELSNLCNLIRKQAPGYEAHEVQISLAKLETTLESFYSCDKDQGSLFLSSVSRAWWAVVNP